VRNCPKTLIALADMDDDDDNRDVDGRCQGEEIGYPLSETDVKKASFADKRRNILLKKNDNELVFTSVFTKRTHEEKHAIMRQSSNTQINNLSLSLSLSHTHTHTHSLSLCVAANVSFNTTPHKTQDLSVDYTQMYTHSTRNQH
jgi:hypothetical protein